MEELCDGVALIHRYKLAFSGPLSELRARHSDMRRLRLSYDGAPEPLLACFPGISVAESAGERLELSPNGKDPAQILEAAVAHGRVRHFEEVEPSLRRIFIR